NSSLHSLILHSLICILYFHPLIKLTIMEPLYIFVIALGIIFISLFLYYIPVGLWITALVSGVRISIGQLFAMRLRKVPPTLIVNALITSTKAGLNITRTELETHFMAGGNVNNVIRALISADKASIALDFRLATAIDLAGRDVSDA